MKYFLLFISITLISSLSTKSAFAQNKEPETLLLPNGRPNLAAAKNATALAAKAHEARSLSYQKVIAKKGIAVKLFQDRKDPKKLILLAHSIAKRSHTIVVSLSLSDDIVGLWRFDVSGSQLRMHPEDRYWAVWEVSCDPRKRPDDINIVSYERHTQRIVSETPSFGQVDN